jgi:hypothetical protein
MKAKAEEDKTIRDNAVTSARNTAKENSLIGKTLKDSDNYKTQLQTFMDAGGGSE